jgi:hypothetical protein
MAKFETYTISTDFTAQSEPPPRVVIPQKLQNEANASLATGKKVVGVEANASMDECVIELEDGYDPVADKATLDAVIQAHDGVPVAASDFVAGELLLWTSTAFVVDAWTKMGVSVLAAPVSSVGGDPTKALGAVNVKYRCDGTKCKVRLVEDDLTTQIVCTPEVELADTSGAWAFTQFTTDTDPRVGLHEYFVEAIRESAGTATLADLEIISVAVKRKT